MDGAERAILLTAQRKAMEILADSAALAQKVASDAEADAVALILEQQKQAASLLAHQAQDIADHEHSEEQARNLLDANEAAAGILAARQDDEATKLQATTTNAAVEVLMAGQREAAAVLLDAWMRVTEGRPSGKG